MIFELISFLTQLIHFLFTFYHSNMCSGNPLIGLGAWLLFLPHVIAPTMNVRRSHPRACKSSCMKQGVPWSRVLLWAGHGPPFTHTGSMPALTVDANNSANTKKRYGFNHGFNVGIQNGTRNHPQYQPYRRLQEQVWQPPANGVLIWVYL